VRRASILIIEDRRHSGLPGHQEKSRNFHRDDSCINLSGLNSEGWGLESCVFLFSESRTENCEPGT
jgi:hypothetical protein